MLAQEQSTASEGPGCDPSYFATFMPTVVVAQSWDVGENYCCGILAQRLQCKILSPSPPKANQILKFKTPHLSLCTLQKCKRTLNELTSTWQAEELPRRHFALAAAAEKARQEGHPGVLWGALLTAQLGTCLQGAAETASHNPTHRLPRACAGSRALLAQFKNLAFNFSIGSCLHRTWAPAF